MPERIQIFRSTNCWAMQTNSRTTIALFGTNILPLPFTLAAPGERVLQSIKELNPQAEVTLQE